MRAHLVGVSGTGMGQLAMLLRDAGHDVSGSDVAFDPPMGPALKDAGIRLLQGYAAEHIGPELELVVVGNAIRKDNLEARRAEELGLRRSSMSAALRDLFLAGRRPLVVAGTHGKTTTSSMCAWVLSAAGFEPGFFIGGLPKNFASGASRGSPKRALRLASNADSSRDDAPELRPAPFVVEGDEYDAVYWHKEPKFFDYVGLDDHEVVIVTSVEHDHIDIYPSADVYEAQFAALVARIPETGLVVCDAHDARARAIVSRHARARTAFYALEGDDTGDVTPTWSAALVPPDPASGAQPFDVYAGGSFCGRFALRVPGAHNVRNALATLAACAEGFGVGVAATRSALASFEGVRRRQDEIGCVRGIRVYDDFAHHPTAVDETLRALRGRHHARDRGASDGGRLWAVFEPRSATACRSIHQNDYVKAFGAADLVLLAPLGRTNVPEAERLDVERLARELGAGARAMASVDAILEHLAREARPGDTIALLSNGAFGGIHARLLAALDAPTAPAKTTPRSNEPAPESP